jgi:hypothetical protein
VNRRSALITAGIASGVIGLISVGALAEHYAGLKGEDWLKNILPFQLALSPVTLVIVSFVSLVAAWLFLRYAKIS